MTRLGTLHPGGLPWRSVLRSFRVLVTGEALARLLGLAAVLIMARELDPGGFGLISLGTAFVLSFALLVDWGTEILGIRDVAREPERFREIAAPILGLRLALCVPTAALLVVAAWLAPVSSADRGVLWLFALMLPMLALNPRWMVLGIGSSKAVAAGAVLGQLLLALGVLAFVTGAHDATVVPLLYTLAELASAAVVLRAVVRRYGAVLPRIDIAAWRRALYQGRPILVNNIARTAVYTFDVLFIAALLGREAVGFYSAAYKPVMFAIAALALFYASFLASYSAAQGRDAGQLFRRSVLLALGLAVPGALAVTIGAGAAVDLLYGDAYEPAAGALAILIWSVPLLAVSGAYASALIAAGRQDRLMTNNVIGAFVNVLLNIAVVPAAGIQGAAAVTLVSEALVLALHVRAVSSLELERTPVRLVVAFLQWHVLPADTRSAER